MNNKDYEFEKLLIIVDMVNGFVREGAMADPYIEHIIPGQLKLIDEYKLKKNGLAFIKDNHKEDCKEFMRYPKHCVIGTSEAELVDEFIPYEKDSLVYKKNSTSTIYAPGFIDDINTMSNLKEVLIAGCCTDICVLNLAIPLQNYFDQIDKNVNITVLEDLVETYHAQYHDRDLYNDFAFKLMKQVGIKIKK